MIKTEREYVLIRRLEGGGSKNYNLAKAYQESLRDHGHSVETQRSNITELTNFYIEGRNGSFTLYETFLKKPPAP